MSQHRAAPRPPQQQPYSESWPPAEGYRAAHAAPKRRWRLFWLVLLGSLAVAATAAAVAGWASASPAASVAGRTADNVRVCQHYRVQRADIKNLAEPTLADVARFAGWIAADSAESTQGTPLRRDFGAWAAAMSKGKGAYAISGRVLSDCAAIGVTAG